MRSHSVAAAVVALLSLSEPAIAAVHVVKVGEKGLLFDPNTVIAAVNDTITFKFYPKNHSVVAGSIDKGCAPSSGGFFSGFVPSSSGAAETQFSIVVNDTNPIPFYCSEMKHCQSGMFGVINPNDKVSLKAYQEAVGKAQSNESPSGGAVGGSLNRGGQTVTDTLPAPTASGSGSPSSSGSGAAATSTSSGIAAAGRHAEVGGTLGAIVGLVALLGI